MASPTRQDHHIIQYMKESFQGQKYGQVGKIVANFVCSVNSQQEGFTEPSQADAKQHVEVISSWAESNSYPTTYCSKYEPLPTTGASLSIYLAPTLAPGSAQLIAFGKLCTWFMTMDDILDELTASQQRNEKNTYVNICQDLKIFECIMNGSLNPKVDGVPAPHSTISELPSLARAMADVRDEFHDAVDGFEENKRHLVKAVNDYLHGYLWRYGTDDATYAGGGAKVGKRVPESTYLFFRRYHSACYIIFESLALLHGLQWSQNGLEELRSTLDFKIFRNSFASVICLTNDVLSLRKEILDSESDNLIIHKYNARGGSKIMKAVRETIAATNFETKEVYIYGKRLIESFPNNQELGKLIEISKLALDGHLTWYGYTKRYGALVRSFKAVSKEEYEAVLNNDDDY